MTRPFAHCHPTLSYVRSSGGYVAETADGRTAAGGSTAQAALAHLTRKLARAEGVFPEPGACPDCFGDGHFEVSRLERGGYQHIAGTRPILFECSLCEGEGIDREAPARQAVAA